MGKHLRYEQRCQLAVLRRGGLTQAAIAAAIGISRSAVSRELHRNGGRRGYHCHRAQQKADGRRSMASAVPRKMTDAVVSVIEAKLCAEQLSPQQISGWMGVTGQTSVSAERPAIVGLRRRIGDWEADTIVGAAHKGAILSLVDRFSKYTLLHKLDAATAEKTTRAIIEKLRRHRTRRHTISADNGKEFAGHRNVARRLGIKFSFATPYHAWERGLNENTNGLVRQYFPKGTRFASVSPKDVARVQNLLNTRPRKTLGYKSPNEVFFGP